MLQPLTGKASRSAHLATARTNVWEGAVRSSKTVASLVAWLAYVADAPPGALAMIGKTERTLKRNVIDPLIELVGPRRCRYRVGVGEVDLLGRLIYVAGANNVAAVSKIQGLTLAGAYGDEIATWPQELFEMLGTRLSVPGARMLGTCNPAGPGHWLKRLWLDRAALWLQRDGTIAEQPNGIDLRRFTFGLDDNPHLSAEFVASLKSTYTGLFYRRYILGEWVPAEGAVFDQWDEARHVVRDLPPIVRWVSVGIDHGTRNPLHAVLVGQGVDGRLHVTSEYRWDSAVQRRQLSDVEYSREVRDWLAAAPIPTTKLRGVTPERIVVDPSATGFRVQLHHDGLMTAPADNEVLPGIRTLSTLLALDLLDVHESCTELLAELPGYSWDDKAAQRGEDVPIKVADHGVDALRYAIHSTRGLWRPALAHKLYAAA